MAYNFEDALRQTCADAQHLAATRGYRTVGALHALTVLLQRRDETIEGLLHQVGIDRADLERRVSQAVPVRGASVDHDVPFSANFSKALTKAMRLAHTLDDSYVGVEHLLVGLVSVLSPPKFLGIVPRRTPGSEILSSVDLTRARLVSALETRAAFNQ